ncbi:MAG: PD40 domain-containing protein [Gemmatimonadaceae bacterium]|nr:PD40 domain-containing protein [Gemmatimonadaceae bacterium]
MMKRAMSVLVMIALSACRSDAPDSGAAPSKRATILPGPGAFGFQFTNDGKRLAFSKLVEGKAAIFVANADGSNAKRVSFGVWDTAPFWSPDGKWVMFNRDAGGQGDVVIVPSDSGPERPVAATSAAEGANAWLPDGSGVLFTRTTTKGQETWVYRLADGTSSKEVNVDGSANGYPSPDGKSVAYTMANGGKFTIWVWDREKKTTRQLTTEGFEFIGYYAFSPDGKSLLYRSARTGTGDIWRLEIATGEKRQLTKDIAEDNSPRWSPDGSRVAFLSTRGGQPDIWVMTNDESDVQRLTDDVVSEGDFKWSADGKGLYATVGLGLNQLYALPLDGGRPIALTSGNWSVQSGEVSPDRSLVAYSGTKNGDEDIWVVKTSGGASHLVSGAPGYDGETAWSPDGKHLAFSSFRSGNLDLWIAPVDSGPAVQLTKWPSNEFSAQWSPDGKTIAFASDRESGSSDLWTVPAAGGTPVRLTRVGNIGRFRWHPDGKRIVFATAGGAGSGPEVMVISTVGGAPKRVAPPTSLSPEWSKDGRELAVMQCDHGYCTMDILSPDGKPLRVAKAPRSVYEFGLRWSSDGQQTLVGWQDIMADGGNRVDLRARGGGPAKTLARPAGFSVFNLGFGDGEKSAIVIGAPNGNALQRIEVPALQAPKPR